MVVETGSMSEAARRLGVTPAAVAQQMRALERELKMPLLSRAGRVVKPTAAGYRVYEKTGPLLRGLADLRLAADEGELCGELRVGAINTALHSVLPDVLAHFVENNPQVQVFIESGTSETLRSRVQENSIDAAVCLHPSFPLSKANGWHFLQSESLVVIAPLRWARREAHELLQNEALIRYDRGLGGGRQADRYLRAAKIVPRERFELSSLLAIGMMVSRGLGISIIPDISSPLLEGQHLARIKLPIETEARRIGILWARASPRLRMVQRLCESAAAICAPPIAKAGD